MNGSQATRYSGLGTAEEPFVVEWLENDSRDPMLFNNGLKRLWTMMVAFSTLTVAFTTSAYTAAPNEVLDEFHVSHEIFTLGLSLFVLGLALGPLIWAPLSELYGRQIIFTATVRRDSEGLYRTHWIVVHRSNRVWHRLCGGSRHGISDRPAVLRRRLRLIVNSPTPAE
jgi:hypothetical protein